MPAFSASALPGRRSWMRIRISCASSSVFTQRNVPQNLRLRPAAYMREISNSRSSAGMKAALNA